MKINMKGAIIMSIKRKCCMCGKEFKVGIGIDGLPLFRRCTSCRKKVKRMKFSAFSARIVE
jgi:endogenous inhibitor of DNA gyrase (YacG/DUF329 family)